MRGKKGGRDAKSFVRGVKASFGLADMNMNMTSITSFIICFVGIALNILCIVCWLQRKESKEIVLIRLKIYAQWAINSSPRSNWTHFPMCITLSITRRTAIIFAILSLAFTFYHFSVRSSAAYFYFASFDCLIVISFCNLFFVFI